MNEMQRRGRKERGKDQRPRFSRYKERRRIEWALGAESVTLWVCVYVGRGCTEWTKKKRKELVVGLQEGPFGKRGSKCRGVRPPGVRERSGHRMTRAQDRFWVVDAQIYPPMTTISREAPLRAFDILHFSCFLSLQVEFVNS